MEAEYALEKRIPMKPVRVMAGNNGGSADGCPYCKKILHEKVKSCTDCGQAVDWTE